MQLVFDLLQPFTSGSLPRNGSGFSEQQRYFQVCNNQQNNVKCEYLLHGTNDQFNFFSLANI
jgi:hypothetical protein